MTYTIKHTPELTEIEKAYLAGFFDGEGCVSITRQKCGRSISLSYNMRVIIGQSGDKGIGLLNYWHNKTSLGSLHEKTIHGLNDKVGFNWIICSNDAVIFLTAILPYLNLKKAEAELAVKFQTTKESITWKKGNSYGGGGNKGGLSQDILNQREAIYQQMSDMKGALNKRGRKPKTNMSGKTA